MESKLPNFQPPPQSDPASSSNLTQSLDQLPQNPIILIKKDVKKDEQRSLTRQYSNDGTPSPLTFETQIKSNFKKSPSALEIYEISEEITDRQNPALVTKVIFPKKGDFFKIPSTEDAIKLVVSLATDHHIHSWMTDDAIIEKISQTLATTELKLNDKQIKISTDEKGRNITIHTEVGDIELYIANPREESDKTMGPTLKRVDIFEKWYDSHQSDLYSREEKYHYNKNEILGAIYTFENVYNSRWSALSKECKDDKIIQMISDMRSAILEDVLGELKAENPDLNYRIMDFGSRDPLSDKDIAISIGSNHQTKEAELAQSLNKIFSEKWSKLPTASIFDINFFTMQYLTTSFNPEFEQQRASLHMEASLLMKMRNLSPEDWALYKSTTIINAGGDWEKSSELIVLFEKLENDNKSFNKRLYVELIDVGLRNSETKDFVIQLLKTIEGSLEPQAKKVFREGLALLESGLIEHEQQTQLIDSLPDNLIFKLYSEIMLESPTLSIIASNQLHEAFKIKYQELEIDCSYITILCDQLEAFEEDPKVIYKELQRLFELCHRYNPGHPPKELITQKNCMQFYEVFKSRRHLEKELQTCFKKIIEFENNELALERLKRTREKLESQSLLGGYKYTDFKNLMELEKKIQNFPPCEKESLEALKSFYNGIQMKLENGEGQLWDLAGFIELTRDRIILSMADFNLKGMLFAQEAHISEGAFHVVVDIIQRKSGEPLTINQGIQALHEIHGFFCAHQNKDEEPLLRAVDVSKYGFRLDTTYDLLCDKAKRMNTSPPPPLSFQLRTYFENFNHLLKFRKKTKEMQPSETLTQESLNHINQEITIFTAQMDTWYRSIPEGTRNKYF